MARVEKNQLLSGALAVARRPFTQLLLLLSVLAWCEAYGGAAGEAASGRDRAIVAELNQRPLIFFVAKGGPDACGAGCSKWIAADGMIDSGAAERFRAFLDQSELRSLPVFFNSPGGIASQSIALGLTLRKYRMTAGVGRTFPNSCRATKPDECRRIAQSKPEQESRLTRVALQDASTLCSGRLHAKWPSTPNLASIPLDTWGHCKHRRLRPRRISTSLTTNCEDI